VLASQAMIARVVLIALVLAAAVQAQSLPRLPLKTSGRWIVDAGGQRFKLAGVNWFGAEELDHVVGGLDVRRLDDLARAIRTLGFNVVRLPFSNELVETDPRIDDARLAANPELKGKSALEVLDAVVDALGRAGVLVVLCDHVSTADWCCATGDGNGLWYNDRYPEAKWLADWRTVARRYRGRKHVIGADLRNELRDGARWGGGGDKDWREAAQKGGRAVLAEAGDWLIFVEGTSFATQFTAAYANPISIPGHLVWSVHDYQWSQPRMPTFDALHAVLGALWGFLLLQDRKFTAPVWVGEFGTAHDDGGLSESNDQGRWFRWLLRYLRESDIDWCYWALNGTQSRGRGRTLGAEETYGVLDRTWNAPASAELVRLLQGIQPATQGPPTKGRPRGLLNVGSW
jgi:endoglucanase